MLNLKWKLNPLPWTTSYKKRGGIMLPERAIIKVPTEAEAECVMEFLEENGVLWVAGQRPTTRTFWNENGSKSCYRLDESRRLCYGTVEHYKAHRYNTPNEWYMLSVDEFIDRCTADDTVGNDELSPADLDEIL